VTRDPEPLLALLGRLQGLWNAQGAPVAHYALPGLTEGRLDEVARTSGFQLAGELREWWAWHNGVAEAPGVPLSTLTAGPGAWELLSLDGALADRTTWMQTMARTGLPWDPTWLPLVAGPQNSRILARTAEGDGYHVPMGFMMLPYEGELGATVAGSLAEVVALWVLALEERYYWYDSTLGGWESRWADVPLELKMRWVI